MWANKWKTLFLSAFFIITISSLTSCGKKAISTSANESTENEAATLFQSSVADSPFTYKTTEVFKGDFTDTLQLKGSPSLSIPTNIFCDTEYGTMIFDESKVERWSFVEVGQTLATVHMDVDAIDIEAKKLKLKRKEERFLTLEAETEASLEEYLLDLYDLTTEKEKLRGQLIYNQMLSDWEYSKSQTMKECSDLQEEILILEAASKISTITSPVNGIIVELTETTSGTSLRNGQLLFSIASYDDLILDVDNTSGQFLTGMSVTVEASSMDGVITTTGTVISASKKSIINDFSTETAQIKLSKDDLSLYLSNNITVYAQVRTFNDVLLVDRNAVTLDNEKAFVTVLNEDGSIIKKQFRFATSNSSYYYILTGLEEGTTVITE